MENSDSKGTLEAVVSSSGWPIASLDEICSIASGITKGRKPPPEPLREVPYMAVVNVQDGRLNLETVKTIQASSSEIERYKLLLGDLLLTEGGDPDKLGRGTVWNGEISECIHQNHIFRVRAASSLINMSFLSRLVASPAGKAYFLSKAKQTTGIASINLTQLRNFPVPLAPLNEQRRIAAKLDTTLAAVDACRLRLDGVEALLKRFRQAVLASATSGELTREWRGERTDGLEWYQAKLSEICSSISDGDHQAPPKATSGIPFITISAISDACLHLERASRFVPSSYYEGLDEARRAVPGDILYSVTGTLGVPALVKTKDPFVFQRHIALLRPDRDFILPKYLYYCLLSDAIKRLCYEGATGTAQLTLPLGVLRNLSLKLPSLVEQAEILLQIENLFSLAHQLEARLTTARKVVDRLTPALLAKAFRGELVPQDPGDEPASVLLERIRAARQAEAGAGKPSRRGRPKAAANPDQLPFDAAPVPPDFLAGLLRECGPLSERALWAVSELEPERFQQQLFRELERGTAREVQANGQVLLEAVG
jgi:type I restriction enzyme S subunit